ncbi:MAG: hypothetical protein KC729_00300 [Candidatus Eisenbacteria bacterium]|uniref:PLAT domain-containing protein n=1 Tax=Eiseniibacteriota bacterium TaxID=2212470 RepID=A0A956LUS2_UNCEI|nr:hypothetical protein [Candidatus Eisenbacteria bacterium]
MRRFLLCSIGALGAVTLLAGATRVAQAVGVVTPFEAIVTDCNDNAWNDAAVTIRLYRNSVLPIYEHTENTGPDGYVIFDDPDFESLPCDHLKVTIVPATEGGNSWESEFVHSGTNCFYNPLAVKEWVEFDAFSGLDCDSVEKGLGQLFYLRWEAPEE